MKGRKIIMKFKKIALILSSLTIMSSMCACGSNQAPSSSNNNTKGALGFGMNEGADGAGSIAGFINNGFGGSVNYYYDRSIQNEFSDTTEVEFTKTAENAVSTFSVDVDTASYQYIKSNILNGFDVEPESVRLEEMLNSFTYSYAEPTNGDPLALTTHMYECPWNEDNLVVQIGLKAEEIDMSNRKPMNIVFLIDTSGSMDNPKKLPLIQKSLEQLVYKLGDKDVVSIVTYAGCSTIALDGAKGSEPDKILDALADLTAWGSTDGEGGIEAAYKLAAKYSANCESSRVILLTDGDFNIGISDDESLTELIKKKAKSGIELLVFGLGYGNLKDDNLEALADNGNGNYGYIGGITDANKCLVESFGGTFFTVAKDVKLQAEFNTDVVEEYRLIGYENRVLDEEDFEDDTVDAGEIGSGHTVTALYEIKLTEGASKGDNLCKLGMRFKEPKGDKSDLREFDVALDVPEVIDPDLAFACSVVEFGMDLSDSKFKGNTSYKTIKELLEKSDTTNKYRAEFVDLVAEYYK